MLNGISTYHTYYFCALENAFQILVISKHFPIVDNTQFRVQAYATSPLVAAPNAAMILLSSTTSIGADCLVGWFVRGLSTFTTNHVQPQETKPSATGLRGFDGGNVLIETRKLRVISVT